VLGDLENRRTAEAAPAARALLAAVAVGVHRLAVSGKLAANGEQKLVFTVPRIIGKGSVVPAASFNYRFTSKEGAIDLQWRIGPALSARDSC